MTTKAELQELLARVEKADGPDRELDAIICAALRYNPVGKHADNRWLWDNFPKWRQGSHRGHVEVVHADGIGGAHWSSEPLTSSLDAVYALEDSINGKASFTVSGNMTIEENCTEWLAAIISALIAEKEQEE